MPLSPGDKLGPYEILTLIGEGGMGEVHKARDTRLNRSVAIKVSKDQFTDRFEREALLVASLNHPHICQLYDVGPNYLVFEYIDGAPLKGPMPPQEALPIAVQIVEALEEAHRHGIVHRDLKPANILLTTHGVKVLDFGLAKQSRESPQVDDETQTSDLTRAGGVMGTPAYMAPEQWRGKPADARSDIYAFGCVLYELLTGERAGRERTPLKSGQLEAIARKCLADDPAKRFQSAAELKIALMEAPKSGGRVRWYAIAAAVLVLLAAGGALFWTRRVQAKPKLTDQDVLVVADFDNKTGDPVFDTALKQALAFQLQQSPFLKAMDEEEVRQTMKLSGRAPDARVTGEVARDICIREGQKAALEGSIVSLGSRYLIALQAVNCQTGETFAREQADAAGKEHVVDALAKATNSMRAKLGESLGTIQGESRAYQQALTTNSLEALQAYYMGDDEWTRTGNSQVAIPLLRRATELDPNFALAFGVLGVFYQNVGDAAHAKEATERAYSLKDRVSERERLFIEQQHYRIVVGDVKKNREIQELLARRYPRDPVFHGNLAGLYLTVGEPEKALTEAQAAIRNGPKIIQGYILASEALAELNRLDDAKVMLQKAISNGFDVPIVHWFLLDLGNAEGDVQAQKLETQWLAGHQSEAIALREEAENAAALGHAKRANELYRNASDLARQHPSEVHPQEILTRAATADALFGKCAPSGNHGPPIVMALCDGAAAKKFAEQQSANVHVPSDGPEAYVRGAALLSAGRGAEAASVFSTIVDHKGRNWGPEYPAAQVGLARSSKLAGDTARAKKTYEQFFAFWKDADPDIPLLLEARREYAALK